MLCPLMVLRRDEGTPHIMEWPQLLTCLPVTGLPVDFEVLSNFCFKCKAPAERPDDPSWQERHLSKCLKNYDGSAKSMEVECALRMWRRSIEINKLRYTTMLCDGDSKSFDAVIHEKP